MPIRAPAVAGSFYPADPAALTHKVRVLLEHATPPGCKTWPQPKALICPHAGYIYSGSTAAQAHALLMPFADTISRVIVLAPTHRVPVRGMAISNADAFSTPLGNVRVDAILSADALRIPEVIADDAAHADEHAIEVQLPFLQLVLKDFSLLPIAVGETSAASVSRLIEALYGGPETLILISSDLSHYLPYKAAQVLDRESVEAVLELDPCLDHKDACGATQINGMLLSAKRHDLAPRLIHLCNSGDTGGDHERVVGYAAVAFTAPATTAS